jgi:hypothetical protein
MSQHWNEPTGGPHQVAIRSEIFERRQREIEDFFDFPLSRLDFNPIFEMETYAVLRFKDKADADRFMSAFGGEAFDPRDLGSGPNWTKWYKGRTAKRKARRDPYDFRSDA